MKKRLLALLLTLALVLSLIPMGVIAQGETTENLEEIAPAAEETLPEENAPAREEGGLLALAKELFAEAATHNTVSGYTGCSHGDSSVTWTPVGKQSDIKVDESGCYYLTDNLTLSSTIAVSTDVDITVCLNGFKLSAPASGSVRRIFRISGGAKVTVCDCTAKVGTLIPGTSKGGVAWIGESGEGFYLYDAVVDGTGVTCSGTGGAICMETATGNILVKNATIKNCTATHGGAIFVSAGTGVVLENATITGNQATKRGGGFDNQAGNIVTVGGKTVITDNYVGKLQQNMNLVNGNRVLNISTTAPLTQGACIGISTRDERAAVTNWAVTTATTQTDAAKYFVSDMGHDMTMVDGKVTITGRTHNPGQYQPGHENVSSWTGTATLPTATGHYYLTSDVYLSSAVSVSTVQDIVLCLNGYNIYQTGEGRIYRLSGGAKLTICDCCAHTDSNGSYTAGKISGGNAATAGAFYMDGSGTSFDLYDGIITGNTTSGNGTLVCQNNAVFNMHGGEISGNTATGSGGALYTNGTFIMTGGTIRNNTSKDATIHIPKGTVTLSGGNISANTVTNTAEAGILTVAAGTTTLSGVTVSGSSAKAIHITGGTVNMTGGKITGMSFSANTGAAVTVKGGSFNLSGGEISGNTSRGVLVDGGTMNLSGSGKVANNTYTAADGSGVRVVSGSFIMTGGQISDNQSATASGAGVTARGGTVTLSGGKITGNSAANGAAVLVAGGAVTLSGTEVSGNTATGNGIVRIDSGSLNITGGKITGNTTGKYGALMTNGGTTNVTGGEISGNSAATNGGGLYLMKGSVTIGGSAVIKNNTANGQTNNIYLPAGQTFALSTLTQGASLGISADLAALYETGKLLLATNAVQEDVLSYVSYDRQINHTMKIQDQGLYLIQDPQSVHTPHTQDECGHETVTWQPWGDTSAMPKTAGHYYLTCNVDTEMVSVSTAEEITICLNGFTVTGNTRIYRLSNGAKVNICDCKAHTDNEGNYVGGKLIPGSTLKGGVVGLFRDDENDAAPAFILYSGIVDGSGVANDNSGMAIRMEGHGTVTIAGGELCNCTNPEGVITLTGGTLNITGGKITGNNARGVLVSDGTLNISGGEISGNTFDGTEGVGVRFIKGTFNMTGGKITGNDALAKNGAAMVIRGGEVNLLGGQISENTAAAAGAIILYDGTVTIDGTKLSDNKVTGSGGAIYQLGGSLSIGKNTSITGNSAKFGAGIYTISGDLTIDGASITGNTATQRGGGVDFASDGVLTINGAAKITGNTANNKPGNLVLVLGEAFVTDGLDEGCQIGIISDLEKLFTEGKLLLGKGVAEDELAYFTNDMQGGHTLAVLEDGLYIIQNPDSVHTPHEKDECGHSDAQWIAWTDMTSLPKTAGHYYLTGNVELTGAVSVAAAEEITLCLNGFDIKQTGEQQRIYRLSGGAVLNLCDCTAYTDSKGNYISGAITGGNTGADAGAGAIYCADAGTIFRLYSGKISGNKTEGSGGAVVANKEAAFFMYGGEISGNTAAGNGAGVYISASTAQLLGGTITSNTAKGEGGGVYCANSEVKLEAVKITNNRGESAAGGVLVGRESKVEFVSGEISGNKGKNGGGMVIQSKGYVNMTGGKISKNQATGGNGGGIYISRDGTFHMRNATVSYNTSQKAGGGLYVCDKADIYSGSITGNHAGKEGGGMYITEASWKDENGKVCYSDAVVNMYGGTISGNTTSVSAAGVLVRGQRGYFNLRGGSITGNKAMSEKSGTGHGGGIIAQGKGNFTMFGGSITDNECVQTSGGIGAYSGATVKLYGGTISGNKAYRGGGVYLAGNDSVIDGVTITKNIAEYEGAGVYVSATKLTMDSGTISENEIIKGNGAGVVLRTEAIMIFNDGEIIQNKTPEGSGGGILIQSSATLTMNGGLVAENYASVSGGGIRSSRCKVEILGGVIRDNVCDVTGGGIYGETELILADCTVSGNRITGDKGGNSGGAGIYLAAQTKYTLENVTVTDNYAIGKAGGMQIGYRCTGSITGCTFTGNSASGNGGGILAYILSQLDMKDTVLEKNSAVGNGGGLFVESDSTVTVDGCAINKNSAKEGGAMHIGAMARVSLTDTEVRSNSALVNGGAIYANGGVYLTDVKITDSANKDTSAAVVLDNAGHDGESYIPSVNQFKGDVIIDGNGNGDLLLLNDAFINIHGDGLGSDARILVYQPDGGITDVIAGPYDYVRNGDIYTITAGQTSLSVADPVTASAELTDPQEQTDGLAPNEGEEKNPLPIILGCAAAVVLIILAAVIAILLKRRKKA